MDAALAQKSDDRPSLSNEGAHNGDEFCRSSSRSATTRYLFLESPSDRIAARDAADRERLGAARIVYVALFFEN